MRKSITTVLLCGAFSLGATASLQAQCGEPDFGPSIGSGDDTVFPLQSLGFAFPFAGATYTDVFISTNGLIYLSNGGTPASGGSGCCNGDATILVGGGPMIAPFWTDLNAVSGTGSVHFNTSIPGKAVITWKNVYEFGGTVPRTIQCQLSPGGEIYFSYDGRVTIATHNVLVGCSEGGGAAVPAATDITAGVSTSTDTLYELFDSATNPFDMVDDTLLVVPTAPGWAWAASSCPAGRNTNYGTGCYTSPTNDDSAYSMIATAAVWGPQLQGTALSFVPTGGSYLMVSAGTYVPPTAAATPLTIGDDAIVSTPTLAVPFVYPGGVTSVLQVCSNGHVAVAPGNSTAWGPTAATMLGNPATAWYSWTDYNPDATSVYGGGQVLFEQVGGIAYITWDNVWHFNSGGATDTFQFQFDANNGTVTIAWDTMATVDPSTTTNLLVGYSPGGPSNDNGSINLTSALPYQVPVAQAALALSADHPLIAGSTTNFSIANIPEVAPGQGVHVAVQLFSATQVPAPGFDLTPLGMPGCVLLTNLDVLLPAVGVSPVATISWSIPANAPLGLMVYTQAASLFQPNSLPNGQNAFGGITSNGIEMMTGSW
ncbi:MAG: hypothetical protein H6835_09640 [Planctomycetes bacterium]|nr:hypothetical protein [Planctomycetota bacterium]